MIYNKSPNTSTSQRLRASVGLEILTNFPFVDVGQSMTTSSCAKVPGPGKKPQSVLTFDSVAPTVTVTFCSQCDTSERWSNNLLTILHYQINLIPPFLIYMTSIRYFNDVLHVFWRLLLPIPNLSIPLLSILTVLM